MNNLFGFNSVKMEEASAPTAEGAGGGASAPASTDTAAEPTPTLVNDAPASTDTPAATNAPAGGSDATAEGDKKDDVPTLVQDGDAPADKKDGDAPAQDAWKDLTEEDYAKVVKADGSIKDPTTGKALEFNQAYIKGMTGVMNKHHISPEAFNDFANEFAKLQMQESQVEKKQIAERFKKANENVAKEFTPADRPAIMAALDKYAPVGSAFRFVVQNSELGAEIGFLKMLKDLGVPLVEDNGTGTGNGVGAAGQGLAELWMKS